MKRIFIALLCLLPFSAMAFTQSGSTFATNGSQSDVQAAINAAPPGSTVTIPSGSFTWSSRVLMTGALHLQGAGASSTTVICGVSDALDVTASSKGHSEISGITFREGSFAVDYRGLVVVNGGSIGQPANPNGVVLFHDNTLSVTQNGEDCLLWTTNGGVIWNCTFSSNDNDNVGVYLKNAAGNTQPGDPWQSPSTIGAADATGLANTYIESCTFTDMFLQAINVDDNARAVIRHNTFNNSAIGSHGQETSPWGVRHFEIYGNTFIFTLSGPTPFGGQYPLNLNYWAEIRGGTGCVYNNAVPDINSQNWGPKASWLMADFNIQRAANNISCQTHYPSARQIGQTWIGTNGYSYSGAAVDGTGYSTDPLYYWGNTGGANANAPSLENYSPDQCGNGMQVSSFVVANRDYFLSPKAGYSPYAYPHPLRSQASSPTPTPTPAPSPTPTPAPTPAPSHTPTPLPSPSATPTPSPSPVPTATPTPQPTSTPASTSAPKPSTWQNQLDTYLAAHGFSGAQVSKINQYIAADPPHLDSQNSYWQWQGEINWYMQHGGFSTSQVQAVDGFTQSNPPS
jgi:hypothetical protein